MTFNPFEVARQALRLGLANIPAVAGVYLLLALAMGTAGAALFALVGPLGVPPFTGFLLSILGNLGGMAAALAIITMVLRNALGQERAFWASLRNGIVRSPLAILCYAMIAIPALLMLAGSGALLEMMPGGPSGAAGIALLGILGGIFTWAVISLMPLMGVIAAEREGIRSVLRAVSMMKGHWWPVFWASLMVGLVLMVVISLASFGYLSFVETSMRGMGADGFPSLSSSAESQVGMFLIAILIYMVAIILIPAIGMGLQVAVYTRLRDIEETRAPRQDLSVGFPDSGEETDLKEIEYSRSQGRTRPHADDPDPE